MVLAGSESESGSGTRERKRCLTREPTGSSPVGSSFISSDLVLYQLLILSNIDWKEGVGGPRKGDRRSEANLERLRAHSEGKEKLLLGGSTAMPTDTEAVRADQVTRSYCFYCSLVGLRGKDTVFVILIEGENVGRKGTPAVLAAAVFLPIQLLLQLSGLSFGFIEDRHIPISWARGS